MRYLVIPGCSKIKTIVNHSINEILTLSTSSSTLEEKYHRNSNAVFQRLHFHMIEQQNSCRLAWFRTSPTYFSFVLCFIAYDPLLHDLYMYRIMCIAVRGLSCCGSYYDICMEHSQPGYPCMIHNETQACKKSCSCRVMI